LTVVVLAQLARLTAGPSAAQCSAAPSSTDAITSRAVTPTDLQFARTAMARGDFRLALNYLLRHLDRWPRGDDGALMALARCVRAQAADECRRGNETQAMELLAQLSKRATAARQARWQAETPATAPDDLVEVERDLQRMHDEITATADGHANPRIDAAVRLAVEAHHWWKPNDRNQVREALRELRRVYDEQGAALSKDAIGRYYEALNRLKALVANAEWETLRMEAGWIQTEVVP